MNTIRERIIGEPGSDEAWICICGNTPVSDGFYPCDAEGNEMEPVVGWNDLYVCARCLRIIDQIRLDVIGRAFECQRYL
jgi:hypothetical protein